MSYDRINGSFVYGDECYVDDYYMDEIWAPINGFRYYMVSNKGRVWSEKTQRFLTVKPMDDHGHLGVCLCQDGRAYYRYIHRLVAEAFIPNPSRYPVVRHLDDDPGLDSEYDLAWGTQRDNIHDAIRNGRKYTLSKEDRERSYEKTRTPIKAIELSTGRVFNFVSQKEASRVLGIPQANIWKVLSGTRPRAQGFIFNYVDRGEDDGRY